MDATKKYHLPLKTLRKNKDFTLTYLMVCVE